MYDLNLNETSPTPLKRSKRTLTRARWKRLQNKVVRESFAQAMKEGFEELSTDLADEEQEGHLFKTVVCMAANGLQRTNGWITGDVQQAIKKKKIAFQIWLHRRDDHSGRRYVDAGRASKMAKKAAKERSWREFGEGLELDYRSANKRLWQTIRQIREKKVGGVGRVRSEHSTFLSNDMNIFCRWREYFSKLHNPLRGPEGGRSEILVEAENSPSVEEVALAIKSLKSGKSVGVDEFWPEMLKAIDEEGV